YRNRVFPLFITICHLDYHFWRRHTSRLALDTSRTDYIQYTWLFGWVCGIDQSVAGKQSGKLLADCASGHLAHLLSSYCLASQPSCNRAMVCNCKEYASSQATRWYMALADFALGYWWWSAASRISLQ